MTAPLRLRRNRDSAEESQRHSGGTVGTMIKRNIVLGLVALLLPVAACAAQPAAVDPPSGAPGPPTGPRWYCSGTPSRKVSRYR